MTKKKRKKAKSKNKGLANIAAITTKSLSSALENFKKNQELKKIKDIKLKKLQEQGHLGEMINIFQKKIIKNNKRICVEGRDIASKILAKTPKYDLAFYFKCNLDVASYRRWLDLKKKVPLKDVKQSLYKRTRMDKKRKNSPLIKVKDAILIRTDKLSKKDVLSKMSKYIERLD